MDFSEFSTLVPTDDRPQVTATPVPGGTTNHESQGMSPVEIGVVSVALAIAVITCGLLASLIGRGR